MMSSKLVAIVMFALTFIVTSLQGGKVDELPSDQLKEAYRIVFATEGETVYAEKTLESLKLLLQFYQDQSDSTEDDRIVDLLKAGDLSKCRCTQDSLNRINELIEKWDSRINVETYLKHYGFKLLELCVPNSEEIFEKHDKLFNSGYIHYYGGKKILAKLKDLKIAMDKDPYNLLGLNRDRVVKLLELADFTETKCNDNTLYLIDSMLSNLSDEEQTHIRLYLEYIMKDLEKFCNKNGKYGVGWKSLF